MTMNKYKDNPLEHLEAWLYESLNSNLVPKDVYEVLVKTIKEQITYHTEGLEKAKSLLELVSGKESTVTNSYFSVDSNVTEAKTQEEWEDFWKGDVSDEDFSSSLNKYGYEYTQSPSYTDDVNLHNHLMSVTPYNDGWTQQHYQNQIPARY